MNVKDTVQKLIKKHDTSNPFEIADNMKIHIIHEELGNTWGYFNEYKRCKMIHLNYKFVEFVERRFEV